MSNRSGTRSCGVWAGCIRRERAREAVRHGAAAGFDNVSARSDDVAAGAERSADWLASVEGLIGLGPEHASLYLLEIIRTRHSGTRWRGAVGRWRRTMMRPRCICEGMGGSTRRYEQYRSRTWPGPAASRATTSRTGRTGSGSASGGRALDPGRRPVEERLGNPRSTCRTVASGGQPQRGAARVRCRTSEHPHGGRAIYGAAALAGTESPGTWIY